MITRFFSRFIRFISSLKLALICLSLIMGLLIIGTLYQATSGAIAAQEKIFRSFFIYWYPDGSQLKIPVFPGGYFLAGIFVLNMTASLIWRINFSRRTLGVLLVHLGLISIVFGELLSGVFSTESIALIKIGKNTDHSLEIRKAELIVADISNGENVSQAIFPEQELTEGNTLKNRKWPFYLNIKKVFPNAVMVSNEENSLSLSKLATEGVGAGVGLAEAPFTTKDGEINYLTACVELVGPEGESNGTWLLSSLIEEDQTFTIQDRQYSLAIRPKWRFFPFSLELIEFRGEMHPGTEIPKSFASFVKLFSREGGVDRQALISMNKPLKYQGRTFYQSGFDKDDGVSVLQVVENPTWAMPYFSSILVFVGLMYQFVCGLLFYNRKKA